MVIKYIHAIFPIFTVFSLDNAQSWEEVYRLRDMIIEAKNDPEVPIVIVANKSDLEVDRSLPHESLEATAIFDWENGYVECSAKERKNINKIFRELLNQTKSRFKISISSPFKTPNQAVSSSSSVVRHLPGKSQYFMSQTREYYTDGANC